MGYPKGYNPLRWDCEKQGCFNKKRRPKIELFADCFPGKINFGDVDGLVEINKRGLLLEWKTEKGPIPTGQRFTYERLTRGEIITVILIVGNAEIMETGGYSIFFDGKESAFREANFLEIKQRVKDWTKWALNFKIPER